MDPETVDALVEAVAGKSQDEILSLLQASTNAEAFSDPGKVAAFLASRASAGT
jgi:hypothetical protein